MSNDTVVSLGVPARVCDPLTELVRTGARGLIEAAVTAEFEEYLSAFVQEKLPDGRQRVVRSGHLPERKLLTGLGEVDVRVPKARSRSGSPEPFRSSLVPPYVRRCASLDAAIAWLYLHGVSTGQRRQAVAALVGEQGARGLSANVVSRLERGWDEEYRQWCRRRLDDDWVYLWADGIYSGLRGERERLCVLVVIGVNARGEKHFLAIEDGVRESTEMSGAKGTRSGAGPSTEPRSPATPMTPGAPHGCPGVLHEFRPSRAARLFGIEPRVPRRRALPRWLMSRPFLRRRRNARATMDTGASPGRTASAPGRAALQARLRRARAEGAEQFHRSPEPDHEHRPRGIPAVPQRADGGRWGAPDHRRDRGGPTGRGSGSTGGDARQDRRDARGRACGGTGRCGLPQRAGSAGAGEPRHRRARNAGACRQVPGGGRPGPAPGHAPHGFLCSDDKPRTLGRDALPLGGSGTRVEGLTRVRMRCAHPPQGSQAIQPVRSAIPPRNTHVE